MRWKPRLMKKSTCLFFLLVITTFIIVFSKFWDHPKSDHVKITKPRHQYWAAHVFENLNGEEEALDIHHEQNLSVEKGHKHQKSKFISIAIGVAVTSRGTKNVTFENLKYKFPFFRTLLPSFCKTSTQGYSYHIYLAFDAQDKFFSQKESLNWFSDTFVTFQKTVCYYVTDLQLHLVECSHNHKPAWAQNDAMMEAYLDDIDYYYRVNDDSLMKSPGWTEVYLQSLQGLRPSNVGVVGPKHYTGNTDILTHDFVHRTHIDIFGFYYPRIFTDWFADDWITSIYEPNRTVKLPQVKVLHTQLLGTRYTNQFGLVQYLKTQIKSDKEAVKRYIDSIQISNVHNSTSDVLYKVISYSLKSTREDDVFGLIRNINLAKIYFPDWYIYAFTTNQILDSKGRLYEKLTKLGCKIHFINESYNNIIPVQIYNYFVQDNEEVDVYIIRNLQARLSERDADGVSDWLNENTGFYCSRDHPFHKVHALNPNLWGAKRTTLNSLLGNKPMKNILLEYFGHLNPNKAIKTDGENERTFLKEILWPKIVSAIYCHDSISCKNWPQSNPFPMKRDGSDFIGKQFSAFEVPLNISDNSPGFRHIFQTMTDCS